MGRVFPDDRPDFLQKLEKEHSPIQRNTESSGFSPRSFEEKEKAPDVKLNNSVILNKSCNNISRYSINIEAQNDIGKITILLNDQKDLDCEDNSKDNVTVKLDYSEDEMLEIDDGDSMSDKNKSIYFETTNKQISFKQVPEIQRATSKYVDSRILD